MALIRKILTCRSNSQGAMIAIYCSVPLFYLFDPKTKSGSHPSIEAGIAASLLMVAAGLVAHFVCRNCRPAA